MSKKGTFGVVVPQVRRERPLPIVLPHTNHQHLKSYSAMSIYEEIEFEDLEFNDEEQLYTYPCPCGDKFVITLAELWDGEDVAPCPSCTLRIRIIYDEENLPPLRKSSVGGLHPAAVEVH